MIDVGAHDGSFFAIPRAQNIDTVVYAIEPIPELADQIRAHQQPNLHVFCMAMGNENGTRTFHINSDPLTSSLLDAKCEGQWQPFSAQLQEARSLEVPVMRLDTFMEQQSLAEVDLLKIDAQGFDLQVLQGAGTAIHRIKQIMVEVQLQPLYEGSATKADIIDYLSDRGFRLVATTTQTNGLEENLQFIRVHHYPHPHYQSEFFEVEVPYIGPILTPKADHVGQLLEEGIFEGLEQAFLWLYLRPGDTFLDCGAHVGLFSCLAAKRFNNQGKIIAFEPNPVCLELYQKNLHRLDCTCFTALSLGLSDRQGSAELHLGKPGMSAFSTFAGDATTHKQIGSDTIQVEQRSLDALVQELNIDYVTFAKLDVEGWEAPVLQGAENSIRAGKFPLWMIEFTEANAVAAGSSTQALRTLIEHLGYTLCRFDPVRLRLIPEPSRQTYLYDNLFAAYDLDAVNQRLATADPTFKQLAQDVITRWGTATTAIELRQRMMQMEQTLNLTQQELSVNITRLKEEQQISQDLRQWAESVQTQFEQERVYPAALLERLKATQQQLEASQHQLEASQHQLGLLEGRFALLRQHLTASRWLKLGRKLGLTKLDEVFPELLEAELAAAHPDGAAASVAVASAGEAPTALTMEMTLQHLAEKGFLPEVVLDLGAAKGYWSEYSQHFFPGATFYMVDPLVESEARLQDLCRTSDRFHYLLCAVGDQPSQLLMNVTSDLDGSSLLSFQREPEPQDRVVQIYRIDDLLAEGQLQAPQLVKMDLQGYELKALAGGQKLFETTEVFIMETSLFQFMPDQPLVHEVVAYMAERGYLLFDVAGHLRRPYQNDLGQLDFVFVKQDHPLRISNRWM
ncbi:MAG: FkbM family methyltransferase [Leptolyngbyaceae cyanobacterium bins.349]|nr:FkbM family methyltransferase [Leptolyngbyaceae cyanobacterium bins.349]